MLLVLSPELELSRRMFGAAGPMQSKFKPFLVRGTNSGKTFGFHVLATRFGVIY